jgi:carboxyl-terminal processing protease
MPQDRPKTAVFIALLPTFALLFGILGFALGWQVGGGKGVPRGSGADVSKVRAAFQRVQERYYPGVAPEALVDGALDGVAARLDAYSEYFTVKEYKAFDETHLRGKFGGVGIRVLLDRESGFVAVESPIEDSPAFGADILPGDWILKVDGWSTKGQPLNDVVGRIKGDADTPVTLEIGRKGKAPFNVTLVRKVIVVKAVKAKLLEDGVGYVRISDFTEMMDLFDKEAGALLEKGAKALVIDLRFNPGGLLGECVRLCDRFLDEGVIVSTRGKIPQDAQKVEAKKGDTLPPIPLVVLVNEGSASASEIFTGAMKDHKRGTIVGARTFGKGLVQTTFPLGDGSAFKLTTAMYFTPSGVNVNRDPGKKDFGIEPDLRIEMSDEENSKLMRKWNDESILKGAKPAAAPEGFRDWQLEAGLEVLRAKLEKRTAKVEPRILGARPAEEK